MLAPADIGQPVSVLVKHLTIQDKVAVCKPPLWEVIPKMLCRPNHAPKLFRDGARGTPNVGQGVFLYFNNINDCEAGPDNA